MRAGNTYNMNTSIHSQLSRFWGYVLIIICSFVLLIIHLPTTPQPWIDEGYFLSVAERVATQGVYAPAEESKVPQFNPSISTGPTVIIPIALFFKLAGVGILQARMVMLYMSMLTIVAFALLSHHLVGRAASLLALTLLIAGTSEPYTSFILMSRQAIGEVPALGFMLFAIWLWLHTGQQLSQAWWKYCCIGFALGLSIITKPQIVMVIPLSLVILAALDHYYYRQYSIGKYFLTGIAMLGLVASWYFIQIAIAGLGIVDENAGDTSTGINQLLQMNPIHIRRSLGSLWRSGFLYMSLPGVVYALIQARHANMQGLKHAWLLVFLLVWIAWFVMMSVGWARYAFFIFSISCIWTANLIIVGIQSWKGSKRLILAVVTCVIILTNLVNLTSRIIMPQDLSTYEFANYLQEHVPAQATILNWEWELDILTTHRYHYPSASVWYTVVNAVQDEREIPVTLFDPASVHPDYIIEGPYASWTQIFRPYILEYGTKLTQIGPYALYEVRK